MIDELLDHFDQFLNISEAVLPETLLCQFTEPSFDGIQPGTAGGREVHVEPGMPLEPALHLRMLVGGVVIHDQMQVEIGWRFRVDLLEELQPFLMPMAWHALSDEFTLGHFQSSEECRGAMTRVVMSERFQSARVQRQALLASFQRLNLALFITGKHQSVFGR